MLRPKTRRRLIILLSIAVIGAVVLSAIVFLQLRRYERHRLFDRAQGMNAFKRGDYNTAAVELSKYLSNDRVDAEAIYDLAICRMHLPRPDMSNLLEARNLFTRFLESIPGNPDAQHQLLDIYTRLQYPAETMTTANKLLETNPNDPAALLAKLQLLLGELRYSEALPIALQLNEVTPLDIRSQITTFELLASLHHPASELLTRGETLLAAHANDPRFQLVRAVASYYTNDLPATKTGCRPPPRAHHRIRVLSCCYRVCSTKCRCGTIPGHCLKKPPPRPMPLPKSRLPLHSGSTNTTSLMPLFPCSPG